MSEGDYIPDFTAYVESEHVRCVHVRLEDTEIENAQRRHEGIGCADDDTESKAGGGGESKSSAQPMRLSLIHI